MAHRGPALRLYGGTRGLYLLFAVLAAVAISYQGYLGGQLVYEYGVGTALYGGASSSPIPQPEATGPATPIPTVYVPTATVTPEAAVPTTAATASETATAMPSATVSAPATPSASPTAPRRAESRFAAERFIDSCAQLPPKRTGVAGSL